MDEIKELKAPKWLNLELIEENEGQFEGLPANPRDIRDEKFELLKQNIENYPEFLQYNALKVLPLENGKYLTIGGNMRLRALKELGKETAPCVIIPADTPIDTLKAYVVLDNSPFGQWDWQMLQGEDWNAEQLQSWGVECDFLSDDFFVDDEPETGSLDDYKEPEKDYLECPHCHHVDSKVHFKKVASNSGANEKDDKELEEALNEDISLGD